VCSLDFAARGGRRGSRRGLGSFTASQPRTRLLRQRISTTSKGQAPPVRGCTGGLEGTRSTRGVAERARFARAGSRRARRETCPRRGYDPPSGAPAVTTPLLENLKGAGQASWRRPPRERVTLERLKLECRACRRTCHASLGGGADRAGHRLRGASHRCAEPASCLPCSQVHARALSAARRRPCSGSRREL
jgi:hypothetical protein